MVGVVFGCYSLTVDWHPARDVSVSACAVELVFSRKTTEFLAEATKTWPVPSLGLAEQGVPGLRDSTASQESVDSHERQVGEATDFICTSDF